MPKKKRWTYRKRRKDDTSNLVICFKSDENKNAPVVSPETAEPKVSIKGKCTMKRELKGLRHELPRSRNDNMGTTGKNSGNRIIHWDSLQNLIYENTVCRHCWAVWYLKRRQLEWQVKLLFPVKIINAKW